MALDILHSNSKNIGEKGAKISHILAIPDALYTYLEPTFETINRIFAKKIGPYSDCVLEPNSNPIRLLDELLSKAEASLARGKETIEVCIGKDGINGKDILVQIKRDVTKKAILQLRAAVKAANEENLFFVFQGD